LLFGAIKEKLGKNFLTEAYVYGMMDNIYDTEFMAAVIKELEDVVDVVSIKEKDAASNHPTGFQFQKGEHPCFQYAKAIRDTGAKVKIGVNGGFQDPAELDEYLKNGDCDLFAMARGLFADEEYMEKVLSGRGEDITPCIWCNKCHGTMTPPWISFCSVNPRLGIDPMLLEAMPEKVTPKKTAVIGGGPIGMRAAIMAAQQGHQVTLFEKTDYLGGQLRHSDYVSFKWPLRDYKDWLKRQLVKNGVTVRLRTKATPSLIEAEGFEAVIAATGAKPKVPKFAQDQEGKLKDGLMTCLDVFGNEEKLGKKVIIVGGSETGVETGMHLCELGHEVTVLTRQNEIAHDASHLHAITMAIITYDPEDYHEIIKCAWEKYDTFHSIVEANTTEVTANSVTYQDAQGESHTLAADSVVICGGMQAQRDEALSFFGTADRFFITGDCEKVANLQAGNRSAMGKVAQL
jgi:NADPH-dependent 2,4-dienoyl-CoA reductase/sulfur reductase-like enzyme